MILNDRLKNLYDAALRINLKTKCFDTIITFYDSVHERQNEDSRYSYLGGMEGGIYKIKWFSYKVDDRGYIYDPWISKDREYEEPMLTMLEDKKCYIKYELKDYNIKTNNEALDSTKVN